MKHLKYFESVYKSDYYQEISQYEYESLIGVKGVVLGANKEKFTDYERNKLEEIFKKSVNPKFTTYEFDKKIKTGTRHLEIYNKVDGDLVGYKSFIYGINKIKDEWFLVFRHLYAPSFESKNYKCDQLSGLIEVLEDQGIINTNETL